MRLSSKNIRNSGLNPEYVARRQIRDEIRLHLDLKIQELQKTGMSRPEAELMAREKFGSISKTTAECIQERKRHLNRMRPVYYAATCAALLIAIGIGTYGYSLTRAKFKLQPANLLIELACDENAKTDVRVKAFKILAEIEPSKANATIATKILSSTEQSRADQVGDDLASTFNPALLPAICLSQKLDQQIRIAAFIRLAHNSHRRKQSVSSELIQKMNNLASHCDNVSAKKIELGIQELTHTTFR